MGEEADFYATHSAEALANVALMGDGDYCTSVSTGSTALYNPQRRHSSLGQVSPVRFENQTSTGAQAA